MALDIGTSLVAFGIFAIALENFWPAMIAFGIAAWVLS